MTNIQFQERLQYSLDYLKKNLDNRITKVTDLLSKKTQEYAKPEDVFHNFNAVAELLASYENETPCGSLVGMYKKHAISMIDIVAKYETNGTLPTKELLQEKMSDTINYNLLFWMMMEEIINKGE